MAMELLKTNAYINPQQTTKMMKRTDKKRRRAVKNEIIHIDDVNALPGDNYCNWIKITKDKLLEREHKLMTLRANILQTLISQQIEQFKVINARMKIYIDNKLYENIINPQLIDNCLNKLNDKLLIPWNGIVLNHSKNKFDTYRKYFTTSRSWFDQRKRAVLAQHLWIPLFDGIKEFTKIAAKRYFNERLYNLQSLFVNSLNLQITTNIFKQKLKLPSTRPHALISCSILKECRTFQLYLKTNIDPLILVNRFLQKNPDMSAVTLMGLVIDILQTTTNKSMSKFQHDVYELYDQFNFTPIYVEPLADYSGNVNNLNRISFQNDDNRSQVSVITNDLFIPEINTTVNDIQTPYYGPYHSQSYSVINERFSPLR